MQFEADRLREERLMNEELVPFDENSHNIEVVKEQILDLNDKFDFLVSLLIKSQKLNVEVSEENDVHDFVVNDQAASSLNADRQSLNLNDDRQMYKTLKQFENKAKEVTGKERKQFRKPEPRKNLVDRVKEAIEQEN